MKLDWQGAGVTGYHRLFCLALCLVISNTCEGLNTASEAEPLRTGDMWHTRSRSPGEIRCFCNLPVCVATGYMCKSEGGGCFSDLEDYPDIYRAKHGCLEMLDSLQQEQCHQPGSNPINPQVLWCCHKDMCNHVDSPENFKFNTSEDRLFLNGAPQTPIGYNNNEVWFKAATIAVPICGVLILFVLIALAIKILLKDSIEQGLIHGGKYGDSIFPPSATHALVLPSARKPSHYHLHNLEDVSSKKVPLLLQNCNESTPTNSNIVPQSIIFLNPKSVHSQTKMSVGEPHYEKNEANAKLNLAGKSCLLSEQGLLVHEKQDLNSSPMSLLHKPNNNSANSNLYRDVNLTLTATPANHLPVNTEGKNYDKQHLTSVVTWGEAAGSASHV